MLQSETDLLAEQLRACRESARTTSATLRDFSAVLAENQRQSAATNTARLEAIDRAGAARQKAANDALLAQLTMMETRLKNLEDSNAVRMDSVRGGAGLEHHPRRQQQKLDEIRGTVEEKLQDTLQQRINDSFKTVSAQLEQVYKGLGEMQNLAADVGSLKQVLSGVKTRGILGEVQLGAILEQILAPASMPAMWRPCRACQPRGVCRQAAGPERHGLAAHRREIPRRYLRPFAGSAGAGRCGRRGRYAQGTE